MESRRRKINFMVFYRDFSPMFYHPILGIIINFLSPFHNMKLRRVCKDFKKKIESVVIQYGNASKNSKLPFEDQTTIDELQTLNPGSSDEIERDRTSIINSMLTCLKFSGYSLKSVTMNVLSHFMLYMKNDHTIDYLHVSVVSTFGLFGFDALANCVIKNKIRVLSLEHYTDRYARSCDDFRFLEKILGCGSVRILYLSGFTIGKGLRNCIEKSKVPLEALHTDIVFNSRLSMADELHNYQSSEDLEDFLSQVRVTSLFISTVFSVNTEDPSYFHLLGNSFIDSLKKNSNIKTLQLGYPLEYIHVDQFKELASVNFQLEKLKNPIICWSVANLIILESLLPSLDHMREINIVNTALSPISSYYISCLCRFVEEKNRRLLRSVNRVEGFRLNFVISVSSRRESFKLFTHPNVGAKMLEMVKKCKSKCREIDFTFKIVDNDWSEIVDFLNCCLDKILV